MVIVKNRQMLFSNREQYIGTSYDNNSTNLSFRLDRINEDGYDMAGLVFKLDIKYSDTNTLNTLNTEKDVNDDYVTLTIPITSSVLAHEGTHIIQIRAYESSGTFKWSSFQNVIYIENSLGSVPASAAALSELEQLEARIDADIASNAAAEAARVTAESARVTAESARVSAESARVSAESARVSAETARASAETAREGAESTRVSTFNTNEAQRASTASASEASRESTFTANESQRTATFNADRAGWEERVTSLERGFDAASLLAQSYAIGGTGTREGEDTDNAKYYKEQAQSIGTGALKYDSEKIHFADLDSNTNGGEASSIVAFDTNGVSKKYTLKDATARSNAATAQSTANTAVSNAATAQSTANTAISNAATAQTKANSAFNNAAIAQNTADTAQTTANNAVSNAATAQSAAEAAQSTANTAVSNASTAQSTADTAVANAATAQTSADNAMERASIQSNDNLLDNPWFTVNQRGSSEYDYSASSVDYTVDRWLKRNTSKIKVLSDGIEYSNNRTDGNSTWFMQKIEKSVLNRIEGNQVTISAIIDNQLISTTYTVPQNGNKTTINNFTLSNGKNVGFCIERNNGEYDDVIIILYDGSESKVTIKCAKLELGSVSTLANDSAPDYATERLKCQRYYCKPVNTSWGDFGFGHAEGTNYYIGLPISTPMRTTPYVTMTGSARFFCYTGSIGESTTAPVVQGAYGTIIWLKFTGNTILANTNVTISPCGNNGLVLEFSADL